MITDAVAYQDGRRVPGELALVDAFEAGSGEGAFVWVHVEEPTADEFAAITTEFNLHPLAVEDALASHQRTKLERYGESLFAVAKAANYDDELGLDLSEVHAFVGPGFIVTAVHGHPLSLDAINAQLESSPHSLTLGPGAVLHAVLDHVADGYFLVIDRLEERVDRTEEQVFANDRRTNPTETIFRLKRDVLTMHRAVQPLVEALDPLVRQHVRDECVSPELAVEFRDVQDHVQRALARLDGARDVLTASFEALLSQISVRQNEDMRAISGWAAVIAVPTLLAGVWGMNFEHMPELSYWWGYPLAICSLIFSALMVYRLLKRNEWL